MLRRLSSLVVSACLVPVALGASLLPADGHAQAASPSARPDASTPAPASSRTEARPPAPAPAATPTRVAAPAEAPVRAPASRPPASTRKAVPTESSSAAVAPSPPSPAPVQAVEYTFLRREDPEADLAQLQQLGAEGWQVVATVDVDGSTRRYVLMRPKR
ncbi:hypothetical protein [Pyxidicoccus trucidator]|uniref:hypothetical protein n=1 Tax=Pyxidicoccus trucidator TaxID=2709662 RepID=UPI00196738F6|nr:hypothetical protein [Pyxidicoccus trucidator]